jgi:hypothetical protein
MGQGKTAKALALFLFTTACVSGAYAQDTNASTDSVSERKSAPTIEELFLSESFEENSSYEEHTNDYFEQLLKRRQLEEQIEKTAVEEPLPEGRLIPYAYYGLLSERRRTAYVFAQKSNSSLETIAQQLPWYLSSGREYLTLIGDNTYYATDQHPYDNNLKKQEYNRFIEGFAVGDGGTRDELENAYDAYQKRTQIYQLDETAITFDSTDHPASTYANGASDPFDGLIGCLDFLHNAGFTVELYRLTTQDMNADISAWLHVTINEVGFDIDPLRDETFTPRHYLLPAKESTE